MLCGTWSDSSHASRHYKRARRRKYWRIIGLLRKGFRSLDKDTQGSTSEVSEWKQLLGSFNSAKFDKLLKEQRFKIEQEANGGYMLFAEHFGGHSSKPEKFQTQNKILTQIQRKFYLFDVTRKANRWRNDEVDYLSHSHQKHLIHFLQSLWLYCWLREKLILVENWW